MKIDFDSPMSIYVEDFGLPRIEFDSTLLDSDRIDIISREYLSFSIVHALLSKSIRDIDVCLLDSRIKKLLDILNKYSINPECSNITSVEDLIKIVEESKEFHKMYYVDYIKNGNVDRTPDELVLPFLHLESFVSQYKKTLNNTSHLGIIIDKSHDIALSSIKAVNSLVGARINKDISMKIVVEASMWDTYIALNGQYVEAVHDYGIIELDNSHGEYVKKIKE